MRKLDIVTPEEREQTILAKGQLPFYPRCPSCRYSQTDELPKEYDTLLDRECDDCLRVRNARKPELSGKRIDYMFIDDEHEDVSAELYDCVINRLPEHMREGLREAITQATRFPNLPEAKVTYEHYPITTSDSLDGLHEKSTAKAEPQPTRKRQLEL